LILCAIAGLLTCSGGSAQQPDPVLEAARKAAAIYARSLPDYIVKLTTKRYVAARLEGFKYQQDTVTADVTFAHGAESYANILVNGVPAMDLPGEGSWSAGAFSTQMPTIFTPESATVFTRQRRETIGKTSSWRYKFAIDQPHSSWHLASQNPHNPPDNLGAPLTYSPDCGGEIRLPPYRSSGRSPVFLAICARSTGPISSPS